MTSNQQKQQSPQDSLFLPRRRPRQQSSTNNNNGTTAQEANLIQDSLKRTRDLLENELERVSHAQVALANDDQLLHASKATLEQLEIKQAQIALRNLQQTRDREQRLLELSVLFFTSVVLYIFWSRVIIKLPLVERLVQITWYYIYKVLSRVGLFSKSKQQSSSFTLKNLVKRVSYGKPYVKPIYRQARQAYRVMIAPVIPIIKASVVEPLTNTFLNLIPIRTNKKPLQQQYQAEEEEENEQDHDQYSGEL